MPDQHPVWFVIDELASLQRLPQLHTAITENRKSQNPVILGFQGRSQMEARYGQDAEAMLSQPATKIFLRTTEPRAAKWVSEAIGEVEIERMRETHYDGSRTGRNFALDRQTEPLVLPSEISGLDDLQGLPEVRQPCRAILVSVHLAATRKVPVSMSERWTTSSCRVIPPRTRHRKRFKGNLARSRNRPCATG